MTADQIIDDIIRREGGYSDRAADRGGPTKFGVTAVTLGEYRGYGRAATRAEVQALEEPEARRIYAVRYIKRPGLDTIADDALQGLLVDIAVNSGSLAAVKMLQKAVHVPADGVLGQQTRDALAAADVRTVYKAVWKARLDLFCALALKEPEVQAFLEVHPRAQLHNLRGWLNRLAEFVR